jgi:hypothetical protein
MPININVKTKIKINGKEYNSPEEMPPDVRSIYERAMAARQNPSSNNQPGVRSKIKFNGQNFSSPDEMPPDVRRAYDGLMAAVGKNGDGIPDSLQSADGSAFEPSAPLLPTQNAGAPSKTDTRSIMRLIAVLLALVLIGMILLAILLKV